MKKWALLVLAFTVIWLLNFNIAMTGAFAHQGDLPWKYALLWEMIGSYGILTLLPFVLWFMARFISHGCRFQGRQERP